MRDEELAEIEARAAAATPGPWLAEKDGGIGMHVSSTHARAQFDFPGVVIGGDEQGLVANWADLLFIAHAREYVPALAAEVRRLTDVAKQAEEAAEAAHRRAELNAERAVHAERELEHAEADYLLIADAVAERSIGPNDLAARARATRERVRELEAERAKAPTRAEIVAWVEQGATEAREELKRELTALREVAEAAREYEAVTHPCYDRECESNVCERAKAERAESRLSKALDQLKAVPHA